MVVKRYESNKRAEKKYASEKLIIKKVCFNSVTDAEFLKQIADVEEPFSSYVKGLIRADLDKKKTK